MPRLLTRRRFLGALLGAAGVGLYTWRVEPHWIEVCRHDLPIAHLPSDLDGARLVQLSDIHVGPRVDDDYLRACFRRVDALEPDYVVLTGDYLTTRAGEELPHALAVLAHLPHGRRGTVGILGNHDYGTPCIHTELADALTGGLRDLGVRVLRNEAADVGGLTFVGLDDLWARRFDPREALVEVRPDQPRLLLCHNPDGADKAGLADYRGWILAGHTHGGQCKPPFLDPPLVPCDNKRYVAGHYPLGEGRELYINRGLGHLLRVRFNVRPEITCFTLRRA